MWMRSRIGILIAAAALAALLGPPAWAHGNPEITVQPAQAPPGGTVTVTGSEWEQGLALQIELRGAAESVTLADVTTSDEGAFTVILTLPADTSPGSYQLVAAGGDDSATVDFEVMGGPVSAPGAAMPTVVEEKTANSVAVAFGFAVGAVALLGAVLAWRRAL